MLNYKKPAFWIIVVAVVACIVVGVCFGTNPTGTVLTKWDTDTVDMNKVLDDVHSLSVQYRDSVVDCNDSETNRFLATMGKIKIGRNPISKSRDEARSAVFIITINESLKLNFNEKFNELWVDNGVKPSYTYKITNPSIAEELLLDFNFTVGIAQDATEDPAMQWAKRPMLVMDGKKYIDPYKPESTLPHGYSFTGTLTAEQAYNTGLEGTQYYTNPNEPDIFYTYQLCGTPIGLGVVDSENRTWQYLRWISADADELNERRLTLDDVRWLAQKGEALSWDDFDAYQGTDIGSGLYIMQYVIDDLFDVLVGGGSREADPEYVRLRNRDINAWVDIRTDDVEEFIKVYSSNVGGVDGESVTVNIRIDVCELYLEVLEDLWNVDPGLNGGISQIGIDLSELSHLTELEKETVMHEFASKHNLPHIAGTWEELCEQGYIDKDNLYWEDGLFFSIKTNEDAVWNLPALKEGDPVPELTAFDAQKWRSGLGAYFFSQCTAQKNADGTWSYTVGQEAIA